jgi:hypothetical protein
MLHGDSSCRQCGAKRGRVSVAVVTTWRTGRQMLLAKDAAFRGASAIVMSVSQAGKDHLRCDIVTQSNASFHDGDKLYGRSCTGADDRVFKPDSA